MCVSWLDHASDLVRDLVLVVVAGFDVRIVATHVLDFVRVHACVIDEGFADYLSDFIFVKGCPEVHLGPVFVKGEINLTFFLIL